MTSLLRHLFSRRRSGFLRRPTRPRHDVCRAEPLESRIALSVNVFQSPNLAGRENWVTVITDQGSDVYLQHVANAERDLFIADNSSFSNRVGEVANFLTDYDTLNVFEGSVLSASNVAWEGYPYGSTLENTLHFVIPSEVIDTTNTISGTLDLAGTLVTFTNNGSGLSFSSTLTTGGPIVGALERGDVFHDLYLTHPSFSGLGTAEVRLREISFDSNSNTGNAVGAVQPRQIQDLPASNPALQVQAYRPFDLQSLGVQYVPGTLRGAIEFNAFGTRRVIPFQVETQDVTISDPFLGKNLLPLSFEDVTTPGVDRRTGDSESVNRLGTMQIPVVFYELPPFSAVTRVAATTIILSGTFDSVTGDVVLKHEVLSDDNFTSANASFRNVSTGTRITNVEIGVQTPAAAVPADVPKVTLFPGQTHTIGLNIELPTPGAEIRIESPVVTAGGAGGQGDVSLAASNILVNAPVFAAETFTVPGASNTVFDTTTERLTVNAATSSDAFTIHLADDPRTNAITRSRLVVSQTGSLSANANVLSPTAGGTTPASLAFIEVTDGDAYIEGTVAADLQSYVMASGVGSEAEAAYVLTTESRLTGVDVGTLVGDTLSITLGNDTLGANYLSLATSRVSLSTDVTRLRTQSSSRAGDALNEMFPYVLAIREADSLIVDAVAGSSEALSITAAADLSLLGAIASQADITLESGNDFQVSAPVSTSFGTISMRGPSVTVNSAVRVLDAAQDERVTDIAIEATGDAAAGAGNLVLNDAVSGLNRVSLTATGSITGLARVRGDVVAAEAGGDVSFSTAANLVTVSTPGTVRVEDDGDVAFEIRRSPDVTLVSLGHDQLVDADGNPATGPGGREAISPTLFADIFDTRELVVSAPHGSIDVLHYGSQNLVVGDVDGIEAGVEVTPGQTAMLAGGSAVIRSTLAPTITVRDFPASLSSAEQVRFATTAPLPSGASYTPGPGEPGTYATVLRVNLAYDKADGDSTNNITTPAEARLVQFDGVRASDIRVGDRVLIKNGKYTDATKTTRDETVNGIYVVLGINFINADNVELTFVRATAYDTTPELDSRQYVTVTGMAGAAPVAKANTLAGKSFVSDGFTTVSPLADNTPLTGDAATPMEVRAVPSRSGYVVARASTVVDLATEAIFAEATAVDAGGFWIDTITARSPGFIDDDAALFGGVSLNLNDLVLVQHRVATPVAGEGVGPVSAAAIGIYEVRNTGSATEQWRLERYRGVDENGDGTVEPVVTGIVTVAEGSLRTAVTGEMFEISYRSLHVDPLTYTALTPYRDAISFDRENPANSFISAFDPTSQVRTDIGTDNPVGVVAYEVSTEGGRNTSAGSFGRVLGVLQDNSAFNGRTREPQPYTTRVGDQVSVIQLEQQLPRISQPIDLINGGQVTIDGSRITTTRDGAVVQTGTIAVGMGPIRPSQAQTARRLVRGVANASNEVHGLEFWPGSEGSVLSDIRIGGFTSGAAIYIAGAGNVLVEDVIIGRDATGSALPNRYGVYVLNVAGGNGTDYTTISDSTIVASTSAGVYLGTNASGVRLVGNQGIGANGQGNAKGIVIDSVAGRNLIGVTAIPDPVAVNAVSRGTELLLPSSVNRDNLYLGQAITSNTAGVFDTDTAITSITNNADGSTTVGLSRPMLNTTAVLIELGDAPRNVIQFNSDGVVLESGSSRMVATDVTRSVFDGIVINGVASGGQHVIGGVAGVTLDEENVAVTANGLSGIRFSSAFFRNLSLADQQAKANRIVIQGNYLGTNVSQSPGLTNGRDGASNIVIEPGRNVEGQLISPDPNSEIRTILQIDATPDDGDPRDGGLRYTAKYRPEDSPTSSEAIVAFEDLDIEGNFHYSGDPITTTGPGGGFGDGGTVRQPFRR